MSKVFEDTTYVALEILLRSVEKTVKKEDLTVEEAKLAGRALGWLALMTAGTDKDIFKMLGDASLELSNVTKGAPKVDIPAVGQRAMKAFGGKKWKKMRGGVAIIPLILGAIALLYGGNTAVNIHTLKTRRDTIRDAALEQISSACPISLALGEPKPPLIDWSGEHAAAVAEYQRNDATCSATKIAVASRVNIAETALSNAWKKLPNDAAAFATATTIVVSGTGATPAAVAVGGAVKVIVESVISGQLPSEPDKLKSFVTALESAFPSGSQVAPPPGPPAGGPGGRRQGKKTQKRVPKRRSTRRRITRYITAPMFKY